MSVKESYFFLEPFGFGDVVAVHTRHIFGVGIFEATVKRIRKLAISVVAYQNEFIGKLLDVFSCDLISVVGGTIVAENDFEPLIGLGH